MPTLNWIGKEKVENHHINPTLGMIDRMCIALGVDLELKEKPSED